MPLFRSGARGDGTPEVVTDRVLTVPNVVSLLRLVGMPFAYLDIVNGRDGRALVILFVLTWSDYVDGYIARRFGQVSRLGQLFDPISDRILVVVVAVAVVVAGIVPLWAIVLLLAREAFVLVGGLVVLIRGLTPPPVTDLGKAATSGIMTAVPMFILARFLDSAQLRGSAWALFLSFVVLYYLSAGQYAVSMLRQVRGATEATA